MYLGFLTFDVKVDDLKEALLSLAPRDRSGNAAHVNCSASIVLNNFVVGVVGPSTNNPSLSSGL